MHPYRTQTCGELRAAHVGQTSRLAGWIHRKRDHGNLLFVDLRDHYGLTQIVATSGTPAFAALEGLRVKTSEAIREGLAFEFKPLGPLKTFPQHVELSFQTCG